MKRAIINKKNTSEEKSKIAAYVNQCNRSEVSNLHKFVMR